MAFYSSGDIKSELIEPSVHNPGDRSEFRIRGDVLSSLKLLNVGQFGAATAYLDDVGALGGIRAMYLYDGKTLLTGLRHFNEHMAFKAIKGSNQENSELDRLLKLHNIGYTTGYDASDVVYAKQTFIKNQNTGNVGGTDAVDNQTRAYLSLAECFNMLQQVPLLTDKVFPQLRLVLEYERTAQRKQKATNVTTQNCRPLLAVDRIMNPKITMGMLSSIKSISWVDHEQETIQVPAATDGVVSNTVKKLLGFQGKTVGRVRVSKAFQDPAATVAANAVVGYGPYSSLQGFAEKFQLRVNGRGLFPRGGVEGSNRNLAMITDSYGSLNLKEDDVMILHADAPELDPAKRGTKSYLGCVVSEKIMDLQIEYTRTGKNDATAASKYNSALNLSVECEVSKMLTFSQGTYLIGYN